MGGKCIHSARFVPRLARYTLGRMVVAKTVASLPFVFFMAALVFAQLCWRELGSSRYLQIGSSNANLAGPSLFFLKYGWRPMYYVNQLLLSENHVFFTLMTLAGIPFYWRQPAFRYIVTLIGSLVFCHTNLIAALSPRYCLYYQPLLILSGVAATVALYDRVLLFARHESDFAVARAVAHATGAAMIFLLFIQSNEWLMRLYLLSSPAATTGLMTRLGNIAMTIAAPHNTCEPFSAR